MPCGACAQTNQSTVLWLFSFERVINGHRIGRVCDV
jgi:hypothetical protein